MNWLHISWKGKQKNVNHDPSPNNEKSPRKISKKVPDRFPKAPAELTINYESPPVVFHGCANSSTGAILSGQLELTVIEAEIRLERLEMELLGTTTTKKPCFKNCPDCHAVTTSIYQWTFLSKSTCFRMGKHSFPFSYLIPGHLPSTSHGSLGSIEYMLSTNAISSNLRSIKFTRKLMIQRAIQPREDRINHQSVGPCNVWVKLTYPEVIHPIGSFPVQVRLTGIVARREKYQIRFVVQKLSWRIDEHFGIVSPACRKHNSKLGGGAQKGIIHRDVTLIGYETVKEGWKNDFTVPGGQADFEFRVSIRPGCQYVCDVESAAGLQVRHTFTLEFVVAEHHIMDEDPKNAIPTGNMYILKATSKQILTDRSELGMSWDEEQPPVYQDNSHSPPDYTIKYHQSEQNVSKNTDVAHS